MPLTVSKIITAVLFGPRRSGRWCCDKAGAWERSCVGAVASCLHECEDDSVRVIAVSVLVFGLCEAGWKSMEIL